MDAFLDQFFNQAVMAKYLPDVIGGLWITLALAGLVIVTGILLGLALACLRSFQIGWVNWLIVIFIDLFRALPPLVLLIVGYFGLPYAGLQLSGFAISWLCLSCVLGAFAEEIFGPASLQSTRVNGRPHGPRAWAFRKRCFALSSRRPSG